MRAPTSWEIKCQKRSFLETHLGISLRRDIPDPEWQLRLCNQRGRNVSKRSVEKAISVQ